MILFLNEIVSFFFQVKINPGSHIQIVKNGVTLRHPSIPSSQMPAQQPFPPANPIPIPTPSSPSQNLIPGFLPVLNSYKPQFFSNKIPQIPSLTSSIANPVNGYNFIDRRYRHIVRQPKSLSKRDNTDEEITETKYPSNEDKVCKNIIKSFFYQSKNKFIFRAIKKKNNKNYFL